MSLVRLIVLQKLKQIHLKQFQYQILGIFNPLYSLFLMCIKIQETTPIKHNIQQYTGTIRARITVLLDCYR